MISDDDIRKAVANIARTPEGLLLYRYLQKELMGVPTTPEAGALLEHNGHRKFAAKLMAMMAEGIDSGQRTGTGSPTDQPVTFVAREPRAVSAGRGAGRRVTDATRVPGYDEPEPEA